MTHFTATYSPDDNKLRLYASTRLDADTYARVKAAGFIWAPKQDLFVAPMWTPERADLLVELAGDIGDEDTTLTERAEERADRFDTYREHRTEDAEQARRAVDAIADGIPLGQPILVGHHSERHARKDAERIENGMRKAIRMWDTAQYWRSRAAGAIRHAKYKERPDVRARRIKTIEADKRKEERQIAKSRAIVKLWAQLDDSHKDGRPCDAELRLNRARYIANHYDHGYVRRDHTFPSGYVGPLGFWDALTADPPLATPDEIKTIADRGHAAIITHCERWIAHYDLRLEYERALLAEAGGLITERTEYPIVPGGRVLVRGEWLTVTRVNRKEGRIVSVTTNARYVRVRGIEEVKDYQPPTTEAIAAVKAAARRPPLVNVDSPDARRMTAAEYSRYPNDYKSTRTIAATPEHGAYRRRTAFSSDGKFRLVSVFLTDQKITPIPEPEDSPNPPPLPPPERTTPQPTYRAPEPTTFDDMRNTLRAGVQVISAPQLFPTPVDIARRVVELADLRPGLSILEPSAGTGRLIDAAALSAWEWSGRLVAVEQNAALASGLRAKYRADAVQVRAADFLQLTPDDLGTFDRIVLNPPFERAADIAHIQHALKFLAPGGRLVAICANGPRQQAQLKPDAETWIELPPDTFAGTGVRAAILAIDAEPASAGDLLDACEPGDDQAQP